MLLQIVSFSVFKCEGYDCRSVNFKLHLYFKVFFFLSSYQLCMPLALYRIKLHWGIHILMQTYGYPELILQSLYIYKTVF